MKFRDIKCEFKNELILVDNLIKTNLKSNIDLIDDISKYIIFYGGKRVRPLVTLLFGKLFNCINDNVILMSSVVELIHTATLLHDDVVDSSEKRRGKLSINVSWGNKEAILVGDFLYTRSFQLMVMVNNIDIFKLMSKTTNIMSEGEVDQLVNKRNFGICESVYFGIIRAKTAQLFASAAAVVPILLHMDSKIVKSVSDYGYHLGMVYQLVDDILDYSSDDEKFGKNLGDDIFSGTFTLPLIKFMSINSYNRDIIQRLVLDLSDNDNLFKIRQLILDSDAIDYTFSLAKKHACLAKEVILNIDDSKYIKMAMDLIDFVLNRRY